MATKRQKRLIIVSSSVSFGLVVLIVAIASWVMRLTINDDWKVNWDFDIPNAQNYITVFDTRSGFHGDGETYTICTYGTSTFERVTHLNLWNNVDQGPASKVSSYVSRFQADVKDVHFDNTTYARLFSKYPIPVKRDSKYFYRLHDDGSYIIAVMDPQQKRVYVLEWFQ
jgi:hypothetical protein